MTEGFVELGGWVVSRDEASRSLPAPFLSSGSSGSSRHFPSALLGAGWQASK